MSLADDNPYPPGHPNHEDWLYGARPVTSEDESPDAEPDGPADDEAVRKAERAARHREQVHKQARLELIRLEARDLAAEEHARRQAERRRELVGTTKPLDWSTFLTEDLRDVEWLAGKVMAEGQQMALVGGGKVGKSLFCLEWAWKMSAGMAFLGDCARRPVRVLYVDQENGHDDIQARLHALGATPETLTNLVYLSFPQFAPLDTAAGGTDLIAAIDAHKAEFVFLDTISRMLEGEENGNDTALNLYRHTLVHLKSRRVGSCRLDHFGKDDSKGARGASAKSQDIDHVWELVQVDGQLLMKRTHTRSGLGRGVFHIQRQGRLLGGERWAAGETRHVLAAGDQQDLPNGWLAASSIARKLDDAGVPRDWGRDRVMKAGVGLGIKVGKAVWSDVVRIRKGAENLPGAGSENSASDAALDYGGNW